MTDNHIGKTIYVASALPATNDDSGFEALTWVKANGVQILPQLGVSHSMTDVTDLQTGFTSGIKGAGQGVDTSMQFRDVASDTGQANLRTAADDADGVLSIKIVEGSGAAQAPATGDPVEYALGIAHSYQKNPGEVGSHKGFTVSFRQNDFTVEGTEPA